MATRTVLTNGFYGGKFLQVGEVYEDDGSRPETDTRPADTFVPSDGSEAPIVADKPDIDIAAAVNAVPPIVSAAPQPSSPAHVAMPDPVAKADQPKRHGDRRR